MGERKVLNKYYPPDLDNWKPPKLELPKDRQYVVRLMAPFTMRCVTCGNHVYKGKKFNARKETVLNEKYLGLPIFRFYIRCPVCLSEITFKTDPESTDYVAEHGAYRTFQAGNIAIKAAEQKQQEKEEEEANNPMLALENRTKESRREMDIIDVLEEIRDVNSQHEGVTFDQLMEKHLERERKEEEEEEQIDDALAKAAFRTVSQKMKRLKNDLEENDFIPETKKSRIEDNKKKESRSSLVAIGNKNNKSKLIGLVKRKDGKNKPHPPDTSKLSHDKPHPLDTSHDKLNVPDIPIPQLSCDTSADKPHASNTPTSLGLLVDYSDEDSLSD